MKQVYEVDEQGYILEIHVKNPSDTEFITIDPPHGLYKAKWNGIAWTEGATQQEIEELTRVEPSPPTAEERITMLEDTINFLLGL